MSKMYLTITIEMGDDAMRSCMDVLNSINHCRLAAEDPTPMYVGEKGKINDRNGNQVGEWETTYHKITERRESSLGGCAPQIL